MFHEYKNFVEQFLKNIRLLSDKIILIIFQINNDFFDELLKENHF
jgi:archaellum biogenesis ATPase FlaH